MESNFSQILSDLRKERKLSQKEVAAALGVSQALLSHYEKGIRECGLGFVVKAADFYGVTCDFLLRENSSRYGFEDMLSLFEDVPEDEELSIMTCYRASAFIRERLRDEDEEFNHRINATYVMSLYLAIISGIRSGNLPASWGGDSERYSNNAYLRFAIGIMQNLQNVPDDCYDKIPEPIPKSIETVVKQAEALIADRMNNLYPIASNSQTELDPRITAPIV